jgi:hypothetical protein
VKCQQTLANLNGLWSYASTEWLRLTIPNPDDRTRSRWPIHPLWGYISSIDWEDNGGPLSRSFKATRLPDDNRIFSLGASSIASYMAKHGMTDFDEGLDRYVLNLFKYFHERGFFMGLSASEYILEKVRLRAREFNTLLNRSEEEQNRLEVDKAAADYQKASDGI